MDFDEPFVFPTISFHVLKPISFDLDKLEKALKGMRHPFHRREGDLTRKAMFYWDLEALGFFSLSLDEQRDLMKAVVVGAWEAAKEARKKPEAKE